MYACFRLTEFLHELMLHSLHSPQVAVAWPDTNSCKTRRCYSKDCDDSNAIDVGVTNALKILQATSSCLDTNTGITLYYCSAQ